MKRLIPIVITLVLLTSIALGGYTFLKIKRQSGKTNNEVIIQTGFLKTKIGKEYLLETDSGLITLIEGKAKPINFMKQTVKVEGVYSGTKLYVNKITPVK